MEKFISSFLSMYDLSSTLFIYKFVFMVELFIMEIIIGVMLKKRAHFIGRVIIVSIALIVITFILPIVVYNSWFLTVLFIVMFTISVLFLKVIYNESFKNLLVCGVLAYSMQHITYSIGNYITNMFSEGFSSVYSQQTFNMSDMRSFVTSASVYLLFCGIIYGFVLLYSNKQKKMAVDNFVLVIIASVMIVANVIMNAIVVYEFIGHFTKKLLTVYFIYDFLTAAMVIGLLCFAINYNRMRDEMKIISALRNKDKQIYNIKKDRIDSVNIMCHDLRHQISKLRKNIHDDNVLNEMEQSVESYSNVYKTGNNVLDIIFAENALYCSSYDIQLICMVDGQSLKSFSENTLYSIFDNLLNNAVDATKNLKSNDKKYIKVIVSKSIGGIVNLSVENPYDNSCLEFEDGLPKSTNVGKLHGYGLRSVNMELDNLGGAMKIQAKDGIFRVSIVIPVEK